MAEIDGSGIVSRSKQEEIRDFIERQAERAIVLQSVYLGDEDGATARRLRGSIARAVASEITRKYNFLELADIMEWKRTMARR